jgi:TonB family protein
MHVLFGVLAAALIGFASIDTADAATRFTFGLLTPVTPVNAIDSAQHSSTCPDPDSNARVTEPYHDGWLNAVAALTNHSNVRMLVNLDSVGNLLQARIADSSGDTFLDQQALIAARGSKYAPDVRNCSSYKRSYFLEIMFEAPNAVLPQAIGGGGRKAIR